MERIMYQCNECNYEFSRKSDFSFNRCPYCGRSGCVEPKKGDYASRIINQVRT